jgi:hypothetical protein
MRVIGRVRVMLPVALVSVGVILAGASSASADQVWHRSVGRVSAASACPTSSAADEAAGWSQWGGTWELWANGGTGGFTCTRSINWAFDEPTKEPTSASVCTPFGGGAYILVDPSGFIPSGAPAYGNGTCSPPVVLFLGGIPYGAAWTSGGVVEASAICQAGNPGVAGIEAMNIFSTWVCILAA